MLAVNNPAISERNWAVSVVGSASVWGRDPGSTVVVVEGGGAGAGGVAVTLGDDVGEASPRGAPGLDVHPKSEAPPTTTPADQTATVPTTLRGRVTG